MANQQRRKQLFETFSANLALYWEESEGRFMCPICLRVYDSASIDMLDLAHIVSPLDL